MESTKLVFIMIDGLADINYGEQTVLQKTTMPNIDYLAKWGITGVYDPVE